MISREIAELIGLVPAPGAFFNGLLDCSPVMVNAQIKFDGNGEGS